MIHNVSNKDLIKIQDLCHEVEQSTRKGYTHDAINFLDSIVYTAKMLKEEIKKGKL